MYQKKRHEKRKTPNRRFGVFNGAPLGIRTPDLCIRSPLLYTAELMAPISYLLKVDSLMLASTSSKQYYRLRTVQLYNINNADVKMHFIFFFCICQKPAMISFNGSCNKNFPHCSLNVTFHFQNSKSYQGPDDGPPAGYQ